VGRPRIKDNVLAAAEKSPHKSALEVDAIEMMRTKVEGIVKV